MLANIPSAAEQAAWDAKADPASTLAGYGIGNAYTKDESLSVETKTKYGLDENATPNDAFRTICNSLDSFSEAPPLSILYKGYYGGCGNLGGGYGQNVPTVENTLCVIIWDPTQGQTTDRYLVLWRDQPYTMFYGVEEGCPLNIEVTWNTNSSGYGAVYISAEDSSLWQVSHFDMPQVSYPYICIGCPRVDIATL